MSTLLLKLAGPLQSWGTTSRFTRRTTQPAPSRSGVLGMIAAAQGRRRTDPLTDLLDLRFAVRVDQAGKLERDFQTSRTLDGSRSMPLTDRYYLSDAVFVAGIEGPGTLVDGIEQALRRPVFPLYLGRRSCPPAGAVVVGQRDDGLYGALAAEPWHAAAWWRRREERRPGGPAPLDLLADAGVVPPGLVREATQTHRDVPVSFDPELREYAWRQVERVTVTPPGVGRTAPGGVDHDPMSLTEPEHDVMALLEED
ncbi:type I-E CRISPR-associated protein Cas5/CasD [Myceligenerans crystallogenes]|uniref:Type I-E CRISPR-associated protein Cas5/CasD n=1 Tax=Myceligenerans crystallogenes TaxID=316335 RepID=A0ABN2NLS4_9MICO